MSTFIKAGLWANKQEGYKGELNINDFIRTLVIAMINEDGIQTYNNITVKDRNDNITIQLVTDENGIGKLVFGNGSTSIWMNDGLFINGITYHSNESGIKPLYYNSSTGQVTYDSDIIYPFEYTTTIPVHSYGKIGDEKNEFAYDGTYLYICTADYVNNSTNIWKRILWTPGTW